MCSSMSHGALHQNRWAALQQIHDAAKAESSTKGLDTVTAQIPPEIEKSFSKRAQRTRLESVALEYVRHEVLRAQNGQRRRTAGKASGQSGEHDGRKLWQSSIGHRWSARSAVAEASHKIRPDSRRHSKTTCSSQASREQGAQTLESSDKPDLPPHARTTTALFRVFWTPPRARTNAAAPVRTRA